ncbi:MAG: hypothetical protein AB1898_29605 [Acidobacteriota bacterium]
MTKQAIRWVVGSRVATFMAFVLCSASLVAQTITPPSITITPGSPVCSGSGNFPVSITLPPAAIVDKVDIFLLFDDTGSFAGFVPTVSSVFSSLVTALETALPGVDFGFGVGRFEDYGGPGNGFSGELAQGRPFVLNQPIVTAATAGGTAARNTLITNALSNTAPGFGGDGPESAIGEGLFQVATGLGFDGDGNGSVLDSGPAGALATQTTPGNSGDVPSFSSNVLPTSGALGGVGFRSGALHLVILATDVCSVASFPAGFPIPATITGSGGSSQAVTAFACSSTTPGSSRFGFVSNSKTLAGNTVLGAVVPAEGATVQGTVNALNALGIRVLGMGPSAAPTTSPGPSFGPSVWLSAIARLTGAVDGNGDALVFDTSVPLPTLTTSIVNAITTTTTLPVDITLGTSVLPSGLSFSFSPSKVDDVPPGGTASFTATLSGSGSVTGNFDIDFVDVGSSATLGTVPVSVSCTISKAEVPVDVKPTSCPNPLNTSDQGTLPVALLSTSVFDVTRVDVTTIKLEGVSPIRSALEDVGTPFLPFSGKKTISDCTTQGPDGFLDLTLKFDAQAVVATLGTVADGDVVVLKLTGKLLPAFGGADIEGEDVMIILKKKK